MIRRGEWTVSRLKYIADCNAESLPEDTDPETSFTYVDISNVTQGKMNVDSAPLRFAEAPSRARRLAKPGDTVVSTVRTYLRAVAAVPDTDRPLVFSTGFAVLQPKSMVDGRFLAYYLQGDEFVDRVVASSTGVSYPAITATELMRFDVRLPDQREQRQIVEFLDRETVKIDGLIAEEEGLVEVLRERWISVVRHAIPSPATESEYADRLSRFTRIGNGSTPRRENAAYWTGGSFPWLNSAVVNQSRVVGSDQYVTDVALAECHLPVVPSGAVLVGLTGQGRTRGMATVLDIDATISQHVAYVNPDRRRWNPEYLRWALTAAYGELRALSDENGSTKGGLTCEDLKRFRLVRPPVQEQKQIAEYLDEETKKIDSLIAEAEGIVGVAKERRSALITAAVTGQIDVWGEVA